MMRHHSFCREPVFFITQVETHWRGGGGRYSCRRALLVAAGSGQVLAFNSREVATGNRVRLADRVALQTKR